MTVVCGANCITVEEVGGKTVEEVQNMVSAMLNVTPDHETVLVDGKQVNDPTEFRLTGQEDELEFLKESGVKG